jgi:hypothetical protein
MKEQRFSDEKKLAKKMRKMGLLGKNGIKPIN